jgi:hypothetical protein
VGAITIPVRAGDWLQIGLWPNCPFEPEIRSIPLTSG